MTRYKDSIGGGVEAVICTLRKRVANEDAGFGFAVKFVIGVGLQPRVAKTTKYT